MGHVWDRREGTSHGLDTAVPTDAPRAPGDFLPPRPGSAKVNGGPGAVRPGLRGLQTHHSLQPNTRLQERANWSRRLSGLDWMPVFPLLQGPYCTKAFCVLSADPRTQGASEKTPTQTALRLRNAPGRPAGRGGLLKINCLHLQAAWKSEIRF